MQDRLEISGPINTEGTHLGGCLLCYEEAGVSEFVKTTKGGCRELGKMRKIYVHRDYVIEKPI